MTYSSTILTDTPVVYYHLDEASGTSAANVGSQGGSGSVANVSWGSAGAGTIGGSSALLSNSSSTPVGVNLTVASWSGSTSWTLETWYKRNTSFSISNANIMSLAGNQGWNRMDINVNWDGTITGGSSGSIATNLGDGNWHHLVATFNAGTMTFYVDGISKGTMTYGYSAGKDTNAVLVFGTRAGLGSGPACYLDESAYYSSVLSPTQVANHYAAGTAVPSTPVTVTPPVMNMTNLTVPAPPVITAGTGKTILPPVQTLALTAPAPTTDIYTPNIVSAMTLALDTPSGVVDITNSIESVVPETMSLSMVAPVVSTTKNATVATPAMAMNLAISAPAVYAMRQLVFVETGDTDNGVYFGIGASGPANAYDVAQFAPVAPAGYTVQSAVLNFQMYQYTSTSPQKLWFGNVATATEGSAFVGTPISYIADNPMIANTFYSVDVTSIVQGWAAGGTNHGIGISRDSATADTGTFRLKGHEAGSQSMRLTVTYAPPFPLVSPTAMTLGLGMAAPVVSETASVNVSAPVMGMALTFPGGITYNPDFAFTAPVITAGLATVDPAVSIQYPTFTAVPPMTLSLGTVAATVDLTTNVLKVAPVMGMSLATVGIFDVAHDRYLNKIISSQLNPLDIWYKLDEASGTTAVDSSFGYGTSTPPNVVGQQNGSYNGAFTQVLDGPQLRKGVHFNGSNFLVMGAYGDSVQNTTDFSTTHALTVEFSIRTTQTDGVVFIGNGFTQRAQSANGPEINGNELRLEAGQLVIVDGTGKKVKVRKNIADGQWHHIVFAIPQYVDGGGTPVDVTQPAYVMVDGDHALVRYNTFLGGTTNYGGQWLPYTVMARATKLTGNLAPNGFLQGDLSNFIVRNNGYLTTDQAQSLYYEWSDANIISPTPITLGLEIEAPKVKGSVKKMLALYGLNFAIGHGAPAVGQPGDKLYQYLDVLSGMVIDNLGGSTNLQSVAGSTQRVWSAPKAFYLDDYFVVPVSIFGNENNDGSFAMSTPGTLNPDSSVTQNGAFVNDENGHPRFINLQEDLSVDVTEEYDVITVVNYPWEKPFDTSVGEYNYITPYHGYGNMAPEQWEQARDDFRDSLLEAVYDGCSMWIGDYYAAMHLGFIQGYDIHDFGRWAGSFAGHGLTSSGLSAVTGQWATNQNSTDGTFEFNMAAQNIDNQHLPAGNQSNLVGSGQGDYLVYPQSNFYRRVTALVPGLTDLPGNDYGPWVEAYNVDDFLPNGNFLAYDILRRPNGLQLGDRVSMQNLWMGSKFFGEVSGTSSLSKPTSRVAITSAHPDGICGTVVSREQDTYYGPNGVVFENPYKNNALTIAAEVGTMVRGRPIGGRVFIELMGTEFGQGYIAEDVDKNRWHGSASGTAGGKYSTWDYDSRRQLEVKDALVKQTFKMEDGNFTFASKTTYFFVYADEVHKWNAYLPMTYRGLSWLGQAPVLAEGDGRGYASAITLTLTTPNATLDKTSSPASQVLGAMRLGLDLRQPANYADGNVEVDLFGGMEMSLELRGLGRTVLATPMSLILTTPNPKLKVDADTVTVYLDEGRNITLFLKEDN